MVSLSKRVFIAAIAVLGLALIATSSAADGIYVYEDANGVPTFFNSKAKKCPPGKKCRLYTRFGKKKRGSGASGASTSSYSSAAAESSSKPDRPARPRADAPLGARPYSDIIERAAADHDLPVELVHAVIQTESAYDSEAVSRAGAQGLMQLMPSTAESMGVTEPFDPEQNIQGGTRYLRRLANRFDGDIIKVLAAYHAGHRAVAERDGIPFAATKRYVKKVLGTYYKLAGTTP